MYWSLTDDTLNCGRPFWRPCFALLPLFRTTVKGSYLQINHLSRTLKPSSQEGMCLWCQIWTEWTRGKPYLIRLFYVQWNCVVVRFLAAGLQRNSTAFNRWWWMWWIHGCLSDTASNLCDATVFFGSNTMNRSLAVMGERWQLMICPDHPAAKHQHLTGPSPASGIQIMS